MSTIAGNGNPGFIGDNGSPLTAGLSGPASVAIDSVAIYSLPIFQTIESAR